MDQLNFLEAPIQNPLKQLPQLPSHLRRFVEPTEWDESDSEPTAIAEWRIRRFIERAGYKQARISRNLGRDSLDG